MKNNLDNPHNSKIKDVVIKQLTKRDDERGWLTEIFRSDDDNYTPAMSYVSFTKLNIIRGPHEHLTQSDFFVFVGPGDFELYLWDNRKNSPTFENHMTIVVGESNKASVIVPPGVVHGYKCISKEGAISINLPDKLYAGVGKKEVVDEIRHENDKNSKFKII
jgi:dTDP-4-dehydrorhamnose 3,5-epimerase